MLVNELRAAMEKYDKPVLKEIIVTLYKSIPKSRKESGLDDLLLNFSKENEKAAKNKPAAVDFDRLEKQVLYFINCAADDLYFKPNKIISKTQRSKWRFEVKRFIKDLLAVGGENSVKSAQLLAGIYEMLSYGCNYYIFPTSNPFTAAGYVQIDFLALVLGKIFYSGYSDETVKTAVYLTLDSNVDRETLNLGLMYTLLDFLKTTDTLEMALKHCVAYKNGYDSYQASKVNFKYNWDKEHRKREYQNYAVELYLLISFRLYEYDEGINYFLMHYKEINNEVNLYCLLMLIDNHDLDDYWIREYEKALKRKIKPRENLMQMYNQKIAERDK